MRNGLYIFLGGGIGSLLRYLIGGLVHRWSGSAFPYGTLTVNILGCFIIGLFLTAADDRFLLAPSLRLFIALGILGGFTTFSSFSFETVAMLRDAQYWLAALNVAGSVALCLIATSLGVMLGKIF